MPSRFASHGMVSSVTESPLPFQLRKRMISVDMDGTIADITERRNIALQHGAEGTVPFYSALLDGKRYHLDEPIAASRDFLWAYVRELGGRIIYLSGRRQGSEQYSEAWLRRHNFPNGEILHRRMGHSSLDFKTRWLRQWQKQHRVDAHFGDRLEDDGGASKLAAVRFVHIVDNSWPSFDSLRSVFESTDAVNSIVSE